MPQTPREAGDRQGVGHQYAPLIQHCTGRDHVPLGAALGLVFICLVSEGGIQPHESFLGRQRAQNHQVPGSRLAWLAVEGELRGNVLLSSRLSHYSKRPGRRVAISGFRPQPRIIAENAPTVALLSLLLRGKTAPAVPCDLRRQHLGRQPGPQYLPGRIRGCFHMAFSAGGAAGTTRHNPAQPGTTRHNPARMAPSLAEIAMTDRPA